MTTTKYTADDVYPYIATGYPVCEKTDRKKAAEYARLLNVIEEAKRPLSRNDICLLLGGVTYSLSIAMYVIGVVKEMCMVSESPEVDWEQPGWWHVRPKSEWITSMEAFQILLEDRRAEQERWRNG